MGAASAWARGEALLCATTAVGAGGVGGKIGGVGRFVPRAQRGQGGLLRGRRRHGRLLGVVDLGEVGPDLGFSSQQGFIGVGESVHVGFVGCRHRRSVRDGNLLVFARNDGGVGVRKGQGGDIGQRNASRVRDQ